MSDRPMFPLRTRFSAFSADSACSARIRLETPLSPELEQTRAEDFGRREPCRPVARVNAENRTGVQHVVQLELRADLRAAYSEVLRQPRVELIDAPLELCLRLE